MKRKRRYTDEPLGPLEVVDDFLPPPEKLVPRQDGVKVTLSLSEDSVSFFKAEAERLGVPYQRMIRNLIDLYVQRARGAPRRRG